MEKQPYVTPQLVELGDVNLIQGGIRLVPADLSAHLAREWD